MTIILNGTFELANGVSRVARVLGEEDWEWAQDTDSVVYTRAAWRTFFPDRAVREVSARLMITLPESANDAEAHELAHALASAMPKGGTLAVTLGETTVTYAQFVPVRWSVKRTGVRLGLDLSIRASNPAVNEELLPQFESGEFQEFEP